MCSRQGGGGQAGTGAVVSSSCRLPGRPCGSSPRSQPSELRSRPPPPYFSSLGIGGHFLPWAASRYCHRTAVGPPNSQGVLSAQFRAAASSPAPTLQWEPHSGLGAEPPGLIQLPHALRSSWSSGGSGLKVKPKSREVARKARTREERVQQAFGGEV